MSDIVDFERAKKRVQKQRKQLKQSAGRKQLLCKNGHHKWEVQTQRRFDVKEGRLATDYRCVHCGKQQTKYI